MLIITVPSYNTYNISQQGEELTVQQGEENVLCLDELRLQLPDTNSESKAQGWAVDMQTEWKPRCGDSTRLAESSTRDEAVGQNQDTFVDLGRSFAGLT